MKRVLVVLAVLMIVPTIAFAQLGVGPAVFYGSPVLLGQSIDLEEANVEQFSFGADVRYRIGWFQASALGLYSIGDVNSIDMFLDAGVALDLAILTFSVGGGPNLTNNHNGGPVMTAGLNARTIVDVKVGPVSAGMSYIMAMNLDDGIRIRTSRGLLGAHVLFWL